MSERPICPSCKKPLKLHTQTIWFDRAEPHTLKWLPDNGGEEIEPGLWRRVISGLPNFYFVDESRIPRSVEDAQRFTNGTVTTVRYNKTRDRLKGTVRSANVWFGEYQATGRYFCSGPCAVAYAEGWHTARLNAGHTK